MATSGRVVARHWEASVALPRRGIVPAMLRPIEVCAAGLILLVLSRAILPLLLHGSADIRASFDQPALVEKVAYWFFYAFVLIQLILRPRALISAARRCSFPIAMVLLALLSAAWSLDPTVTVRIAITLGFATVFGLYLATRFRSRELVWFLTAVFGISAVLSLAFGLFLPSYGVEHGVNGWAWEGIYTQKNTLGQMMLFAAVIIRSVPGRSVQSQLLRWSGISLALVLLILSQSVSAMLCLGAILVMYPLLKRFRRHRLRSALTLAVGYVLCSTAFVLNTNADTVFGEMGKDRTLTGRTYIWSAVMGQIAERPLLGYGFGAFWLPDSGPGSRVRELIHWSTPDAHSGYLDIAAELGLLGTLIVIGSLAQAWRRAWQRWIRGRGTLDDWRLALLFAFALIGTVDATLVSVGCIWILLVTITASEIDDLPADSVNGYIRAEVASRSFKLGQCW